MFEDYYMTADNVAKALKISKSFAYRVIRKMNAEYCNEKIKDVYHELFDDALQRYNEKQKRADRRIENYYEKIRTGRQEKLFHEIIIQIGNHEDTNVKTPEGELAERILDEYYQDF